MNFKDVQHVRHKVQHILQTLTFILELILALIVTAIIVMQGIHLIKLFVAHVFDPAVTVQYSDFLKEALDIIVGVEFLKMLCQHSMSSVIDVLLFVLARHLVVVESTMLESLLCIISVAILFAVRKFLMIRPLAQKGQKQESSNHH